MCSVRINRGQNPIVKATRFSLIDAAENIMPLKRSSNEISGGSQVVFISVIMYGFAQKLFIMPVTKWPLFTSFKQSAGSVKTICLSSTVQ